ncbi:MAG: hypothetical protein QF393_17780, partial [Rhodospirillales bacterium]|nr:hypothetical protein [Rhodospirillales bacterium]
KAAGTQEEIPGTEDHLDRERPQPTPYPLYAHPRCSGCGCQADRHGTIILIRQIRDATQENTPEKHVFGGALSIIKKAGKTTITALDVPGTVCFEVAWGLVNRGRVIINGLYSRKLSPTIIRELCAKKGAKADLTFRPKK